MLETVRTVIVMMEGDLTRGRDVKMEAQSEEKMINRILMQVDKVETQLSNQMLNGLLALRTTGETTELQTLQLTMKPKDGVQTLSRLPGNEAEKAWLSKP